MFIGAKRSKERRSVLKMNRKSSKIMCLLMTLIMVGSSLAGLAHIVGASNVTVMTTGSRVAEVEMNDDPQHANAATSGVGITGSLEISTATDYEDWFTIACTRPQVLNVSLYLVTYDVVDTGKYNFQLELYGPDAMGTYDNPLKWFSHMLTRWETASTLCIGSGTYYVRVVVNATGGGQPSTQPDTYKLDITTSNAIPLTGGQSDQKTLTQGGPNWFEWYKITTSKDQSFQVKVTPPANEVINMDMYGIWNRGFDMSAGNQTLQPWYLNGSAASQVGTVEQMTGMTGDMDVYVRLWLTKDQGAGAYKFDVTNILIPSDNDNVPTGATVIPETASILNHLQQSMDTMDWYKFTIDAAYTADIMFNPEGSKLSYWNMTLWDSALAYINGSFDTVSGHPYIKPDPQNHIAGNPTTGSISHMKWKPPATGTYYISIAGLALDPDHLTDMSKGPLDQNYRLYIQLPNWGPQNKSKISDADINENQVFKINVSTYFKDPEGDKLSFTGRVDNTKIGFKKESTGNVTVTPPFNWAGECNVTVDATDGMANIGANTISQTFKLTVHEVDDAPYVVQDYFFVNFTMSEGQKDAQTYPYQLNHATVGGSTRGVFADIDGAMTFSWTGGTHVHVRMDAKTTNVYFSADDHWFGVENITFTAKYKETVPATDKVKVTVKHTNHGPTRRGDKETYAINMDENEQPDLSLKASDMFDDIDVGDPNYVTGDVLNYTIGLPTPLHLNVTILKDNTIRIELEKYWSGDVDFTVVCADIFGATNTTKVSVKVKHIDQAPSIDGFTPKSKDLTINDGQNQVFTLTSISDIDNDTKYDIRYSWYVNNDLQTDENVKNQQFTFRTVLPPNQGFGAGSYVIKVVISDGLLTDETEWNITVLKVNQAPKGARIISPSANVQYEQGKALSFQSDKSVNDPDGDQLYYKWVINASGKETTLSDQANFVFDWKNKDTSKLMGPGLHKIDFIVSDNKGGFDRTSVVVTIKAKPKPAGVIPGFEAAILLVAVLVALVAFGKRKFKHV
jgi:hypothetical protein